ncbi:histone H1.10-like [Xenopus laevis]|uniref:Histone H1.10-like n=1 Tax=Xenopus laevis TaxID=8355 RepID=A0A8J0VE40_XENLA|nr:histone H1.10-like [Xenopus laevis]
MRHLSALPQQTGPPARKKRKKNQLGWYSQLVVDKIRKLGERNGSSLAKKEPWFDQRKGHTYLKYSIKALLRNKTLTHTKGIGANGSFRLNLQTLSWKHGRKKATAARSAIRKVAWVTKRHSRGHSRGHKAKPKKARHVRVATKKPKKAERSLPQRDPYSQHKPLLHLPTLCCQ